MIKLNKYKIRFGEWDKDNIPKPRDRTPEEDSVVKPVKSKKKTTKVA